jgi:hypothetical protein
MAFMKYFRSLGLLATVGAALAIGGAVPAAADYGNSGGNVQLYQATASMNCDNPSLCGNLGGFWAWGEFNADGTFSAEVTFCSHLQAPGGFNGAGHEHADGHYILTQIFPGSGLRIVIVNETDTLTGLGGGQVVNSGPEFTPVGPAAKAHLSTTQLLGFSAPGVTFQVTVTPMHN